jgi:adenine phosphoribosyltransferase
LRQVRTCTAEVTSIEHHLSGGSAKAAGELIAKQGGKTLEYLFVIELMFLKGADKLDAPVYSIVQSDD